MSYCAKAHDKMKSLIVALSPPSACVYGLKSAAD